MSDVRTGNARTGTALVYGGERALRLELAGLLREDGYRVLLASTPAEAAKALASGTVDVIGALSPLMHAPSSAARVVEAMEAADAETDDEPGHGRASTDALAWRERIRRITLQPDGQPTSSA